jgi:hypothetical protein
LIVVSVIARSGTIIHSVRERLSFAVSTSSKAAASAPLFATRSRFLFRIEADYAMAAAHQPFSHICAHTPQAEFQRISLLVREYVLASEPSLCACVDAACATKRLARHGQSFTTPASAAAAIGSLASDACGCRRQPPS